MNVFFLIARLDLTSSPIPLTFKPFKASPQPDGFIPNSQFRPEPNIDKFQPQPSPMTNAFGGIGSLLGSAFGSNTGAVSQTVNGGNSEYGGGALGNSGGSNNGGGSNGGILGVITNTIKEIGDRKNGVNNGAGGSAAQLLSSLMGGGTGETGNSGASGGGNNWLKNIGGGSFDASQFTNIFQSL